MDQDSATVTLAAVACTIESEDTHRHTNTSEICAHPLAHVVPDTHTRGHDDGQDRAAHQHVSQLQESTKATSDAHPDSTRAFAVLRAVTANTAHSTTTDVGTVVDSNLERNGASTRQRELIHASVWLEVWDGLRGASQAHVVDCCSALHGLLAAQGNYTRLLVASFIPALVYRYMYSLAKAEVRISLASQ